MTTIDPTHCKFCSRHKSECPEKILVAGEHGGSICKDCIRKCARLMRLANAMPFVYGKLIGFDQAPPETPLPPAA